MYQIEFKRCREEGGLAIKVVLMIDAEGVYKSLTSCDLKTFGGDEWSPGVQSWREEAYATSYDRVSQ